MRSATRLSAEESRIVAAALEPLSRRARRPLSLDGLIDRWGCFAVQVEQGYNLTIYDYTDDLSTRDLLEDILNQVPAPLRKRLLAQIEAWDNRFRQATTESERPLRPRRAGAPRWWWFRIPKKIDGELGADLRAEGVLS
jgi:hypothetical protein